MTSLGAQVLQRSPSAALTRFGASVAPRSDAAVRRRLGLVWGFLFLNVLTYYTKSVLVPMPHSVGKLITQGSLTVALVIALSVNRKVVIRPNLFLFLLTPLLSLHLLQSLTDLPGIALVDPHAS